MGREAQEAPVVLLVEDDVSTLFSLECLLHSWSFKTYSAMTGYEATERLADHPDISIVFSDIQLPDGMSGFQLARTVRTVMPHVSVLLGTAYNPENIVKMTDFSHDFQVIHKPYDTDQIKLLLTAMSLKEPEQKSVPSKAAPFSAKKFDT